MKLRRIATAVGGGLGLAAAANRALRTRAGDPDPPLDGETGYYRWRGFDIAYTEGGDPENPDIVLAHGVNIVGSSYEFRDLFADLAEDHHVIAPDLPGFGRSDRPPLLYSGSLYATFLEDFLADVAAAPTVVASSLTGAYAAVAARDLGEDRPVGEVVLVCPTAETFPGRRVWLRSLLRSPVLGEAAFNLIASKASIEYFNADHGYHDASLITDELVDYQWRTAHRPGARYAPASFLSGFLDLDVDLGAVLADVGAPVTLVWGRQAGTTPLEEGQDLAEAADVRLVSIDRAGIQPHVEHPEQFLREVVRGTAGE